MFSKSSWIHLRIPFSFYLLPVYLFALASSTTVNVYYAVIVFIVLHIFLYPASNAYNSFYDKDEGSIGGLKKPPKVDKSLYFLAMLFDSIAMVIGLYNFNFFFMLLLYSLVSKAYSHPGTRIKKYPFGSWLIAGIFQGFFSFIMAYVGINNLETVAVNSYQILFAAALTSFMLLGSYPMTQIYQHEEDEHRGDITLSLKLGILGTFHFVMVMFAISSVLFTWYFSHFYSSITAMIYLAAMFPVVSYFFYWYIKVRKNKSNADYDHTMRLNFISAFCLNVFFIWLFVS